jgi:5-oxoprolinase (ATP-hydrolysing) subunit A
LTDGVSPANVSAVKRVSLNVDLGELPDESEEFYSLATIVNIACGGHAGDDSTMTRAVSLAQRTGAKIAAHPSYSDRENFGRKSISMTAQGLALSLRSQINDLVRIAESAQMSIVAVKPHGALYHDARSSTFAAEILLITIEHFMESKPGFRCAMVGPPDGVLKTSTIDRNIPYIAEGFADRNYLSNGSLVPRSEPNALIHDPKEAAAQAVRLARSCQFDTLCVHGDTPNALEIARAVCKALQDAQLLEGA